MEQVGFQRDVFQGSLSLLTMWLILCWLILSAHVVISVSVEPTSVLSKAEADDRSPQPETDEPSIHGYPWCSGESMVDLRVSNDGSTMINGHSPS